MAYRPVTAVRVSAWGATVGAIATAGAGATVFRYDPAWLRRGLELAPRLLPVSEGARPRTTRIDRESDTFHGIPALLADALPDAFGNAVIDAALAAEGVDRRRITALDRLAYVGQRGMGALVFEPDTGPRELPTAVVLRDLVEAARRAVVGDLRAEDERTQAMRELIAVGTSAGGARPKAVVAWDRRSGELRAGNLPAPEGFEQWLIKFDGVGAADHELGRSQPYTRVEYAYAAMARQAGIPMSETALIEEGGRAHFATRRFDRPGGGQRLHLQTFSGLTGLDYNQFGAHDYAELFLAMTDIAGDDPAMRQDLYRRMVFNVLASNNDDHLKNFSMLMTPEGRWSLSPAYDLTFSYNPDSPLWLRTHAIGIRGRLDAIAVQDVLALGDRFQVPGQRDLIRQVQAAVAEWPRHAAEAGVGPDRAATIQARLDQVAADFGRLPGTRAPAH